MSRDTIGGAPRAVLYGPKPPPNAAGRWSCGDGASTARLRPRLAAVFAAALLVALLASLLVAGAAGAQAQRGVTVSTTALTVPEGSSATYTVVLDTRPAAAVYVTVARNASGDPDLTPMPFSLVFTTTNWNTPQVVTVSAAADPDGADGAATISHDVFSFGDTAYSGIAAADVAVTEDDDDTPAVLVNGRSAATVELTVPEGGETRYSLVLATRPLDDVSIAVTRSGDTDVTASPATLVFEVANWDRPQTVTLSAVPDADAADGAGSIAHTATSGDSDYNAASIPDVDFAEVDDDTPGLTLSTTDVQMEEGGAADLTIVLDTEPAENVTVELKPIINAASRFFSLSASRLTFTPDDWNAPQTVTFTSLDDDTYDRRQFLYRVRVTAGDAAYRRLAGTEVLVTASDTDLPELVFSTTELSVPEGASAIWTVRPDRAPVRDFVVALSRSGDSDLSAAPGELYFTAGNWRHPQSVRVRAAQDDDLVNGRAGFLHVIFDDEEREVIAETVGLTGIPAGTVTVTEVDDEFAGARLTPAELSVPEGGSASYRVTLGSRPAHPVTLSVTRSGDPDLSAAPQSLVFTPANWDAPQAVTVSAAPDADAAGGAAQFRHTAASDDGAYDGLDTGVVTAREADNVEAGVTVSPAALEVREGASASYSVALDFPPVAEVTLRVARAGDADLEASPAALVFTPADWNAPQAVTVSAAQDGDGVDGTAAFVYAAQSDDPFYDGIAVARVDAREIDDDDAGVSVSAAAVTVSEGGSASYTLSLDVAPAANVTIAVARQAGGDPHLTASPASVVFTTANWDVPQEVTVSAAEDPDDSDGTAVFLHTATSGDSDYDGLAIDPVAAAESDDDRRRGLAFTGLTGGPGAIQIAPEGDDRTYHIHLTARPSANVTVALSVRSAQSDAVYPAVRPGSIIFTPQDWNVPRAVTVSTAEDDDEAAGEFRVWHGLTSADDGYHGLGYGVRILQADNDRDIGVTVSPTRIVVPEGSSASYTIAVTGEAGAVEDAFLTVTRASGDADLTASADAEKFGVLDLEVVVTVSAALDADETDGSATFVHTLRSEDPAFDGYVLPAVTAVELDRGVTGTGVSVLPESLTVDEGGSGTYQIVLNARPAANVTVAVSRNAAGDADLAASPASLVFTPANWNAPRTVTVSARADGDSTNGRAVFLHAASSDDAGYAGIVTPSVTVTERDASGAAMLPAPVFEQPDAVVPEGRSASYTVRLDRPPPADVVLAVVPSQDGVVFTEPVNLHFDAENWRIPQSVRVTAVQDDDAVDDRVSLLHLWGGEPGQDLYDQAEVSVEFTVTDDDSPAIVVSPPELAVGEGRSATYTVALATEPREAVSVTVSRSGDGDLSADPAVLVFDRTNWQSPQQVTVSAAEDNDEAAGRATLTHVTVGGAGDYRDVAAATLDVVEVDDDPAAATLSRSRVTLDEGAMATWTVALDKPPGSEVRVAVTRTGDPGLVAGPAELVFGTDDWDAAQTVTVSAEHDDDGADGSAVFSHAATSADPDYDGFALGAVAVSATDDDPAGVTVSAERLSVTESDFRTYTLALDTRPAAPVDIAVSVAGDTDLSALALTPDQSLTFTAQNWNVPQLVAVFAANDDDALDGTAVVSHSAESADGDYHGLEIAAVQVTERDDDTPGLVFAPAPLRVPEGASAGYGVSLATRPAAPVQVQIVAPRDAPVSVNPTSLDFTVDDWNQPQQVSVSAQRDRDDADASATLVHSATSADPGYGIQTALAVQVVDAEGQPGLAVSATDLTVPEGGEAAFTVALSAEPAGDVTVAVRRAEGDIDLVRTSPEELLFTPQDWAVEQTVAFAAREDPDSVNGAAAWRVAVLAAPQDPALQGLQVDVQLTESDYNPAGVTVSELSLVVDENGSGSWTIVLWTEPVEPVDVAIEREAGGDADLEVDVSQEGLRFTADNWDVPQTVVVTAAADPDYLDGTATFVHTAASEDPAYHGVAIAPVTIRENDVDSPDVTVSRTSLDVPEGGSESWTVKLDVQPQADVTVTVSRESGDTDLTATPAALTFTSDDYDTPQAVTVAATEDDDRLDGAATFVHVAESADADYDGIAIDPVAVTELDDDRLGLLVVTPAANLVVDEGGSAIWTFTLSDVPRAPVTVSVARESGDADLSATPNELTFGAQNWNVGQVVTIAAEPDDDGVDGEAFFSIRSESEDGLFSNSMHGTAKATENDDDTPRVSVSPTRLTAQEGGSAFWEVALDTAPLHQVTVTVARSQDGDADLAATPGELVFDAKSWNVAQTVTVEAAEDDDARDDAATFRHSAASDDGAYHDIAIADVEVSAVDDDTPGVTLSTRALVVREAAAAGYTVTLATRPAATVTVAVAAAGGNDAGLTIDPESLEFTPGKWNEPQTVTVTAPDDPDALDAAVALTHVAASGDDAYDTLQAVPLEVSVVDDDAGGLSVSRMSVDVEEGGSGAWRVVLRAQPDAEVRVAIVRGEAGDADLTVSPAGLVFTTANWDSAQEVTVSAMQDDDAAAGTAVFVHTADSADPLFDEAEASVEAAEIDDDEAGMTLSAAELDVTEGGSAGYTVVLDAEPAADVTVTVQAAAGGDPDLKADPAMLVFTPDDWDRPRTVTVSAAADTDGLDGEAVFVHAAASGDAIFAALAAARLPVREVDGNPPGVRLSRTAVPVPEGLSASYTLVLASEPADDVIVEVTRKQDGDADLTARPLTLIFGAGNWNAPQQVTVTAAEDADGDAGAAEFLHTARSNDPAYEGIDIDSAQAAEEDNDRIAVLVTPPRLSVPEGLSADWTVALGSRPSADVVVTLAPQAGGDADLTADPTELVFTPDDWNAAQAVTVAAAEDADEAAGTAGFTVAAASGDAGYAGLADASVQAVEEDDDPAAVTLSATALSVPEDSSATYTLALRSRPSAPVTVGVTVSGDADLTVTPLDLVFTPDNWNAPQTVTVWAAADADAVDGAAVVRHDAISGDTDYHLVAIGRLDAAEDDDDVAGVTIAPLDLSVPEGSTAAYTAVLATRPAAEVTVRVARTGDADLSADVDLLVFAPDDWNAAQTVTVRAADDADAAAGVARFIHTVSSDDDAYDGLTVDRVVATEDDPDVPGVTVDPVNLSVPEGASAAYDVVLDLAPAADVTITVTRLGDADLSSDRVRLVFTPANWNVAQTVTVSAALDADGIAGVARFTHTAASGDGAYDGIAIDTVVAAEKDREAAGVSVSRAELVVAEGRSETYTLVLDRAPAPQATVRIAVERQAGGDGDLTAAPALLTFTAANWDLPQTVTITAVQDADETDGTAVFAHAATSDDSDYDGLAIDPVAAAEQDDDRRRGLVFTGLAGGPGRIQFVREGAARTHHIALNTRPSADVTVVLTLGRLAQGVEPAVRPGSIVFTPQDWSVPRAVTVSTANDDNDHASRDFDVKYNLTSADPVYHDLRYTVRFLEADNGHEVRLTVTPTRVVVPEGSSATYTISLTAASLDDAFLTVTRASGDADLTASADAGQFGAIDTDVVVTVSAAPDADAVEGSATFVHTLRSNDPLFDGLEVEAVVAVEDEDRGAVTVSAASVTVEEGRSAMYRIGLENQPDSDVTITVARVPGGDEDLIAAPPTLVFTPDNWSVPQTVTVTAAADDDALDGMATFTHAVTSGDTNYDGITVGAVAAAEVDSGRDAVAISVLNPPLEVNEGSEAIYEIKLTSVPTANVTVAVSTSGNVHAALTASPASFTFTPEDWFIPQTVTVSADEDDDAVNGAATVTHAASGGIYQGITSKLAVTEVDNDTAGITASIAATATLEVDEGGTAQYTMVLDTQPTADVTVAVARDPEEADISTDLTSLTFTTANWAMPQTVTVSGVRDDDGADDHASLVHTSTSAELGYEGLEARVAVVARDANPPGVTVSVSQLRVAEGATNSYDLVLDSRPGADVTISVQVAAGGDTDITARPQQLTFTPANWNTAQLVEVAADADEDAIAGSATLEHAAASEDGDYAGVAIDPVAVTEIDDDAPDVMVSPTQLHVIEGSQAALTVALNTRPAAEVRIGLQLAAGGDADLALLDTALVFTPGNWDTPQTARVSAAEDADARVGRATVRYQAASSDTGYDGISGTLSVLEADNDAAGAVISPGAVVVPEGGSASYTITLTKEPAATVLVDITQSPGLSLDADLTPVPSRLEFTTGNWSEPRTVQIRAAEDDDAVSTTSVLFVHRATADSDPDYAGKSLGGVLTASEEDNDRAGVTLSRTSLSVIEGKTAAWTVRLDSEPTFDVIVSVARHPDDPGDEDLQLSGGAETLTLTFTPANWNQPQQVVVEAAQDVDGVAGQARFVLSAVSPNPRNPRNFGEYHMIHIPPVEVLEKDNDRPGISILPAAAVQPGIELTEEGEAGSWTVRLDTQPAAEVTISIMGRSDGFSSFTINPETLVFTSENWSVPQTVSVSAGADDDNAVSGRTVFEHTAQSDDRGYAILPAATAIALEIDDDEPGISVSVETLAVLEQGTGEYEVALDTRPAEDVTVTVAPATDGDADLTVDKTELVFTGSDWDTPQTVVVSARDDPDVDNGERVFAHSATSADAGYDGIEAAAVTVTEVDNDTHGLTLSATSLSVEEGAEVAYTVVLDVPPADGTEVSVSAAEESGAGKLVVSGPPLVFDAKDWNVPQTVTVGGVEDDDGVDESGSIVHTVTSGDEEYDGLDLLPVTVDVTDDDIPGVTVSTNRVTVVEGSQAEYTVALATRPSAEVTVSAALVPVYDASLAVSPATMAFAPESWNTPQTVTVTAEHDGDAAGGSASIAHTAVSDDEVYKDIDVFPVAVALVDDDRIGVTVSPARLVVDEGSSGQWEVTLNTRPAANVVVSIERKAGGDPDLSASPAALTFLASSWNVAQTVTVTADEDSDGVDGSAVYTVSSASTDSDYDTSNGTGNFDVEAVEADRDTIGIVVSRTSLVVSEGGSASWTVRLGAEPAADVRVDVTRSSTGDVDLVASPASFVFTPANWDLARRVTVAAQADADYADGSAAFVHAATSADPDYDGLSVEVNATEKDDDANRLVLSDSKLPVVEGASNTYTVALDAAPRTNVTVRVSRLDGNAQVTFTPSQLQFTPDDWQVPKTVTVTVADNNRRGQAFRNLRNRVTGQGSGFHNVSADIEIDVVDDESRSVFVSRKDFSVAEGGSVAYTVGLSQAPASNVTVTMGRRPGGDSDLTVSPTTLRFTPDDWAARSVTISAAQDADAADGNAAFEHTAPGWTQSDLLRVKEIDDDAPGVTVSAESIEVEEGDSASWTVVLHTRPVGGNVIIQVYWASGDGDLDADPPALTFTPQNWNTPQAVTVTAEEDGDAVAGSALFTHEARGADYAGVVIDAVQVTEVDNDAVGVSVSPTRIVVEEGASAAYEVKLTSRPVAPVRVAVTRQSGDTDLRATPPSLTFTPQSWNTAQQVRVSAAIDAGDDRDGTAVFAHAATSADAGYHGVAIDPVEAVERDRDRAAGVTLSAQSLTVPEGATASWTVVLDGEPRADVTIAVARASGDGDLSADPAELVFTPQNWAAAQRVTVTAMEDADRADGSGTFSHTGASDDASYAGMDFGSVVVAEVDNDVPEVRVSETHLTVDEGSSETYTLMLSIAPAQDVTVSVASIGDDSVSVRPSSLTFGSTDWMTPKEVTVSAADDPDPVSGSAVIAHGTSSADPDYDEMNPASVSVATVDDDAVTVAVSPAALTVAEGDSAAYSVVLQVQPTEDVTVALTRSGDADLSADPQRLVFTAANWNAVQKVTVSAAEDPDAADGEATFAFVVTSGDTGYHLVRVDPVTATEDDNDRAGITVSTAALSVVEGLTGAYTVALGAAPTAEVTVSVVVKSGETKVTVSPQSLVFSAADWSRPQEVTVLAVEDDGEVDDSATLVHAAVSDDAGYRTAEFGEIAVSITDDDPAGVTIDPTTLRVAEGASAVYTVVLDAPPSADVVLTVEPTGDEDLRGVPGTLTFTPANWNAVQRVTVSAVPDEDAVEGRTVFTRLAFSDDPDYQDIRIDPVTVTEADSPSLASVERHDGTSAQAEATNADTLAFRLTFSEEVRNVDGADFAVTGGAGAVSSVAPVAGSGARYLVTLGGADLVGHEGVVGVRLAPGQNIVDADGNALAAAGPTGTNETYTVDNTAPLVALARADGLDTLLTGAFDVTVTFTEDNGLQTSGAGAFTAADLDVTNGSVTALSGGPLEWTATLTPDADFEGDARVELPAGRVQDAAGNANTAPPPLSVPLDAAAPAVVSVERHDGTSARAEITSADTLAFRVTFSEPVLNVDTADFDATGSTAAASSVEPVTGSPVQVIVTFEGGNLNDLDGEVGLTSAPGHDIADAAGNALSAAAPTAANETYTLDNTAPLAALARANGETATALGAFDVTVTFTEANGLQTTGDGAFTVGDLQVTNGEPALAATADPLVWTATVTPAANVMDDVVVEIPAGAVLDVAGNGNAAAELRVAADNTAPAVVSIERHDGTNAQAELTNADRLAFRVTFSEAVTNVGTADFAVTGAATAPVDSATGVAGNAAQVVVTVSGGDLNDFNGEVGLTLASGHDIADTAGNVVTVSAPSGADETYTLDNTAPTVASIERHDGTSAFGAPTNAGTLAFRVTFSEAVLNVDMADFDATGTTTGDATQVAAVAGNAAQFVVTLGGGDLDDFDGEVGLTFATGHDIADAVGNALTATTPSGVDETYALDNTAPAVTAIERHDGTSAQAALTNADTLTFRVTFSEAARGVNAADFVVNGVTTATVSSAEPVTGSAGQFVVTVGGGDLNDLNGVVGLDLAAGQDIDDAAGNALVAITPSSGTDET